MLALCVYVRVFRTNTGVCGFTTAIPRLIFFPWESGGFAEVFVAVSDDRLSDFLFMWCFLNGSSI